MDASRSTTVIPVSSRPPPRGQGTPSGLLASTPRQCRRNLVTAVLARASCSSPASDSARHTVGVDGTGPITGARCRRPWKSLIASPPRISISARPGSTWPRSYTGSNPGRRSSRIRTTTSSRPWRSFGPLKMMCRSAWPAAVALLVQVISNSGGQLRAQALALDPGQDVSGPAGSRRGPPGPERGDGCDSGDEKPCQEPGRGAAHAGPRLLSGRPFSAWIMSSLLPQGVVRPGRRDGSGGLDRRLGRHSMSGTFVRGTPDPRPGRPRKTDPRVHSQLPRPTGRRPDVQVTTLTPGAKCSTSAASRSVSRRQLLAGRLAQILQLIQGTRDKHQARPGPLVPGTGVAFQAVQPCPELRRL